MSSDQIVSFEINGNKDESYQVLVHDVFGKTLFSKNIVLTSLESSSVSLNSNLSSGIYFVSAIDKYNRQIIKKLVVN